MKDDALPDLPGLKSSSDAGCEFCGFLRTIIRSIDTHDVARAWIGQGLDAFYRVGTFHPADFPKQSDGLRFLKEKSEVEEVVLV